MYATKFMRVLLRAKTPYFSNWGMELLTNQVSDLFYRNLLSKGFLIVTLQMYAIFDG